MARCALRNAYTDVRVIVGYFYLGIYSNTANI